MIPFFTLASVAFRGYRMAKMNIDRSQTIATGPPIGSPEYFDLRSNAPLVESSVPPGTKNNHLHEVESKDSYRVLSRSYDLNLSQSPRAPSLTSRVKTGGKFSAIPKGYFYTKKKGVSCAPGFKLIGNKCVKQ
jgi:hypothetical protein